MRDQLSNGLFELTSRISGGKERKSLAILSEADEDCLDSLVDLHKIIREDLQTLEHPATRLLEQWNFVQKDLLPLLRSLPSVSQIYRRSDIHSQKTLRYILRLLVLLTNPLPQDVEQLREERTQRQANIIAQDARARTIKAQLCDKELLSLFSVFFQRAALIPATQRTKDDTMIIDLTLLIICNLLRVPDQVPMGASRGISTNQHLQQLHVDFVMALHASRMLDSILFLCKVTTTRVSKQHQEWNLRILSLFRLLFGEQDSISLVIQPSAQLHPALPSSSTDSAGALQREKSEKAKLKSHVALSGRHPRFGGTFMVKDSKGVAKGSLNRLVEQVDTQVRMCRAPQPLDSNNRSKAYRPRTKKTGLGLGMRSSHSEAPIASIRHTTESRKFFCTLALTIVQQLFGSLSKRVQAEIHSLGSNCELLDSDYENFLWFTSFFTSFFYYYTSHRANDTFLQNLTGLSITATERKLLSMKKLLAAEPSVVRRSRSSLSDSEDSENGMMDYVVEDAQDGADTLDRSSRSAVPLELDELMDLAGLSDDEEDQTSADMLDFRIDPTIDTARSEALMAPHIVLERDTRDEQSAEETESDSSSSSTTTAPLNATNPDTLPLVFMDDEEEQVSLAMDEPETAEVPYEEESTPSGHDQQESAPANPATLPMEFHEEDDEEEEPEVVSTPSSDTMINPIPIPNLPPIEAIGQQAVAPDSPKATTECEATLNELESSEPVVEAPPATLDLQYNTVDTQTLDIDMLDQEAEAGEEPAPPSPQVEEEEMSDIESEADITATKEQEIAAWWAAWNEGEQETSPVNFETSMQTMQQTLKKEAFLFVSRRLTEYREEKNWSSLETCVTCLRSYLLLVDSLFHSKVADLRSFARKLLRSVFFDRERFYMELLPILLREYSPSHIPLTRPYLSYLLECAHLTIRLMQSLSKEGAIFVLSKSFRNISRLDEDEGDAVEPEAASNTDQEVFELESYTKRFIHRDLIHNLTFLLDTYWSNSANTNHHLAKLMLRIASDHQHEFMFYRLSVFRVFERLLQDPRTMRERRFRELRDITSWIVRRFHSASQRAPELFMAILFANTTSQWSSYLNRTGPSYDSDNESDAEAPARAQPTEVEVRPNQCQQRVVIDGQIVYFIWAAPQEQLTRTWSLEEDSELLSLVKEYSYLLNRDPFTILQSLMKAADFDLTEAQIAYRLVAMQKFTLPQVKEHAPQLFATKPPPTRRTPRSHDPTGAKNDIRDIIRNMEDSDEEEEPTKWVNKPLSEKAERRKRRASKREEAKNSSSTPRKSKSTPRKKKRSRRSAGLDLDLSDDDEEPRKKTRRLVRHTPTEPESIVESTPDTDNGLLVEFSSDDESETLALLSAPSKKSRRRSKPSAPKKSKSRKSRGRSSRSPSRSPSRERIARAASPSPVKEKRAKKASRSPPRKAQTPKRLKKKATSPSPSPTRKKNTKSRASKAKPRTKAPPKKKQEEEEEVLMELSEMSESSTQEAPPTLDLRLEPESDSEEVLLELSE